MTEKCENCWYWKTDVFHPHVYARTSGECRRNPPYKQNQSADYPGGWGVWIATQAAQWCGEWRAKDEHHRSG